MSSSQIEQMRDAAASERLEATRTTLPLVRARHLRAAEAWDVMVEHAERTERLTAANADGKVKYAYQRQQLS